MLGSDADSDTVVPLPYVGGANPVRVTATQSTSSSHHVTTPVAWHTIYAQYIFENPKDGYRSRGNYRIFLAYD